MKNNRQTFTMRQIVSMMTVITMLTSSSLLYGCFGKPEKSLSSIILEGGNALWSVTAYTSDQDLKYLTAVFYNHAADHIFDEHGIVSFAIGTSIGTSSYSYSKSNGYIDSEYSNDQTERVVRTSDDTFEVLFDFETLFDRDILGKNKQDKYKHIIAQIGADCETIHLLPAE